MIAARPLSRLTYKIMSINLITVLILIIGVAYLDRYREQLVNAETETLSLETRLYAAILSQNAVRNGRIDQPQAEKIVANLIAQKPQQIYLFSDEGSLLFETGTSGSQEKKNAGEAKFKTRVVSLIEDSFAAIVDVIAIRFNLPLYPATNPGDFRSFPDIADALEGNISLSAWQSQNNGLILSAAAPVESDGQKAGAILVIRPDTNIQKTFAMMRMDILNLFFISLMITITFSLYLSAAIGHPLRTLASAAEAIRKGKSLETEIPDLSERNDEVGELSTALRQMTESLNEKLGAIERFAADVAHELKNPLTSMRSAFETLEKVSNEESRKKLNDIIIHDLLRMDRLISDISQASRIDAELPRDILESIDLREVLIPLIESLRRSRDEGGQKNPSGSEIVFSGLGAPVIVLGHRLRLTQVFQNLIENALTFSPPGHPVVVKVEPQEAFVSVIIEDDGPGIPPGKEEKIFARFYSERPAGEAFGTHSGLGLSIVRQIVTAHGGTVKAENRTDEGGICHGARFITQLRIPKNTRGSAE